MQGRNTCRCITPSSAAKGRCARRGASPPRILLIGWDDPCSVPTPGAVNLCLKEETPMNMIVLLVAASCTPAADPLPVMETGPYAVPSSIRAATQEWPDASQANRPRFFARVRGLFGRRSRAMQSPSPGLSGYSQGMAGNSTIIPGPISSPGTSMADTNPPIFHSQPSSALPSGPTLRPMPAGQPF